MNGRNFYFLGRPSSTWLEATARHRPRSGGTVRPATAVVSGAGRGLGRLVAEHLAATGVAVGLVSRSGDELDEVAGRINAAGGAAATVTADLSDEDAARATLDELGDRLGPIDLLVNNAAIPGPVGPAWEVDGDAWWRTIEVNLGATYNCTRIAVAGMVARRRGRIVNVTSRAGEFRWPTVSAYSVSKAAVIKFTENLAAETRRHGVSVFSFHPGLLPIGFTTAADPRLATTAYERRIFSWLHHELAEGRGSDPREAAAGIVRLASGRYDALSGRHLSVHDDLDAALAAAGDRPH